MRRMGRVIAGIFLVSLWRELAHRANLFFQILTTAAGMAAGLAALGVLYSQTASLAGWSLAESIVLLGTYQLVSGVLATFIEPNLAWFSGQVKSGKLDEVLLKPVPSILLASLGTCAPLALSQVGLGMVVLWVGIAGLETPPALWNVAGWLLMLAVGIAITWASRVALASLAFWAPHLELEVLYNALWQFGRYPVDIYRQPVRTILLYILPVAFVSTVPAHFLTRQASPEWLFIGLAAGVGAVAAVQALWKAGLARYTSATS